MSCGDTIGKKDYREELQHVKFVQLKAKMSLKKIRLVDGFIASVKETQPLRTNPDQDDHQLSTQPISLS